MVPRSAEPRNLFAVVLRMIGEYGRRGSQNNVGLRISVSRVRAKSMRDVCLDDGISATWTATRPAADRTDDAPRPTARRPDYKSPLLGQIFGHAEGHLAIVR